MAKTGWVAAALAALGLMGAAALAQSPAPQKPAVESGVDEPDDTTVTFGDWSVHCVRSEPGSRACELTQTLEVRGQGPVAEMAVGRTGPKAPLLVSAQLPVNIALPSVVLVASDERDDAPIELNWKRCRASGCLAQGELKDDALRKWRAQNGHGFIHFVSAPGQRLSFVFSFRGFAAALESFAKASN